MRVFYLYQINDFCKDLYEKYPYRLYHILKDVYYTSKYNQPIAISSYEQITQKFNKQFVNNFIHQCYKLEAYYYRQNNIHIISSVREYSKLFISSYSINLKTNIGYPKFFDCINNYSDSIFVCDFENNDYFWLNRVINKKKTIVKE